MAGCAPAFTYGCNWQVSIAQISRVPPAARRAGANILEPIVYRPRLRTLVVSTFNPLRTLATFSHRSFIPLVQ